MADLGSETLKKKETEMSALEELQGIAATWHLRGIEGGYVTIQGVRRWAQEIRELRAENFSMRGELGGIEAMVVPEVLRQLQQEADDSARVVGEFAVENIMLKERIEELQTERDRLKAANAQLKLQLAIAESGKDPLREM